MRRDRAVVRTVVVVALLVVARVSLAQETPPGNLAAAYPSPSWQGTFSREFSHDRLGRWLRAADRHQPGATDESLRAILGWSLNELLRATRDLDDLRAVLQRGGASARVPGCNCTVTQFLQSLGLTPAYAAGDELLMRGALLHTDAAIVVHTEAARTDRVNVVPAAAGWHLGAARDCVSSLRRSDPFVRRWYLAVAGFLEWRHEIASLPAFVEAALKLFPSDRDLLLIAGCMHEYLAAPRIQDSSAISRAIAGNAEAHLRQAEKAFRGATGPGTPPPELSMRLGRVLGLSGRHDDALAVLKPALDAPADVTFLYFINLFIGDEEAALTHDDLAQQAYARAQAIFPSAQSAYLAASRVASRAGDRPRAAAAVQSMLTAESEDVHPWLHYYVAGRQAQADRFLGELRAPLRKANTQ